MASTMTAQSTFLGTSVQAKAPKCVPAQPAHRGRPGRPGLKVAGRERRACRWRACGGGPPSSRRDAAC